MREYHTYVRKDHECILFAFAFVYVVSKDLSLHWSLKAFDTISQGGIGDLGSPSLNLWVGPQSTCIMQIMFVCMRSKFEMCVFG